MTPERLDFIEARITKNRSSPDLDELALELVAALRKRLAPAVVATNSTAPMPPVPAFHQETGMRHEHGDIPAPAVTPAEAPKAHKKAGK